MTAQSRASIRAGARLAVWALALSIVISRLGLVLHELGGHGVAALLAGGSVTEVHLYTFGGGWIGYDGEQAWTAPTVVAVSLAGIAIELVTAGALALIARARRDRDDLITTSLLGAALGLAIHAGFYLAAGTADGFGDGAGLHRSLGANRVALVAPVAIALVAIALAGGRRLGGALHAMLPAASRRCHIVTLAGALAVAGLVHGGLVAGELAVRPSPTYQRVMQTARDRAIAADLARWQAEAARAGRTITVDERRQAARTIAARHPGRRLGPPLAIVIGLAAVVGLFTARAGRPRALARRAIAMTAVIAIATVILVVVIDVVAASLC